MAYQRSNNTSSMCPNIRAYKNGTQSWPTNTDLNNSDIAGARDFMMYSILSSKLSQTESSNYLVSDNPQSCIDEVASYIRSQQKKEVAYPNEAPLVVH
jgi:hypothetical protein